MLTPLKAAIKANPASEGREREWERDFAYPYSILYSLRSVLVSLGFS